VLEDVTEKALSQLVEDVKIKQLLEQKKDAFTEQDERIRKRPNKFS
jgi:hypothetical protein